MSHDATAPEVAGHEVTAKARVASIVEDQPDDSSYDEILRELAFHRMILKGLVDVREGHLVDDADLRRRVRRWCENNDRERAARDGARRG